MKFQKIRRKPTIGNDLHCNENSLTEMIEITNQSVKNPNPIDKISNYERTFLKSALKSERQLLV